MVRGFSRFVLFLFLDLLRAPARNSPERVRDTIWIFPEKSGKPPGLASPKLTAFFSVFVFAFSFTDTCLCKHLGLSDLIQSRAAPAKHVAGMSGPEYQNQARQKHTIGNKIVTVLNLFWKNCHCRQNYNLLTLLFWPMTKIRGKYSSFGTLNGAAAMNVPARSFTNIDWTN